MGLKRERSPDTADGALAHAGAVGHRMIVPVSDVVRCRFQGQHDNFLDVGVGDLTGSAGPWFVQEPI